MNNTSNKSSTTSASIDASTIRKKPSVSLYPTPSEPPESHDLEAHIDELRELDKVRRKSADLRDKGHLGLFQLISEKHGDFAQIMTTEIKSERVDYVTALLVSRRQSRTPRKRDPEKISELNQRMKSLTVRIKSVAEKTDLKMIEQDSFSVILAAQILRTLVSESEFALSKASIVCWYWMIREIYSATEPDWCVGGAQAGAHGRVTAYSTAQCVQAILDFADAFKVTGEFFVAVNEIEKKRFLLLEMEKQFKNTKNWCKQDKKRLLKSGYISLALLVEKTVINLHFPMVEGGTDNPENKLETYTKNLPSNLKAEIETILQNLKNANKEITDFLNTNSTSSDKLVCHELAMLDKLRRALGEIKDDTDWEPSSSRFNWESLAEKFKGISKTIREGINPALLYLETVIDDQLGTASPATRSQLQPAELAFAATAYWRLKQRHEGDREYLEHATAVLCEIAASDTLMQNTRPFHRLPNRIGTRLTFPEVAGGIAQLINQMRYPIDTYLAKRLLLYFEQFCVEVKVKTTRESALGWPGDDCRRVKDASVIETANAVESLTTINRMLDDSINDVILDHFSVKYPAELGLDELFYPDYGLATAQNKDIARESIAHTLQTMRCHITPFASAKKGLRSLILHGPAGTGKTMLVEALARTCNVPLIEVTPSDIAKRGEEAIEQRARTVFEALALLTRVVILFDEFDPVLKRRETHNERTFTFFSFLTPGMLPKLKTLNDKAKERSIAYVLITNLIGTLDEAAIREGRFDKKVGIFPPDTLSRYGRLMLLCTANSHINKSKIVYKDRVLNVLSATGGLGMTSLTQQGWFIYKKGKSLENKTPMGYLLDRKMYLPDSWPDPEEKFEKMKLRGSGPAAEKEYLEWGWLNAWDESNAWDREKKERKDSSLTIEGLLSWTTLDSQLFKKAEHCIKKLHNDLKTTEQRALIGLLGDEILLRWKEQNTGISPKLEKLFSGIPDANQMREKCGTHILSPDDLFIFKQCAEQVLIRKIFDDPAVVSHIVHIHVLTQDFFKHQQTAIANLEKDELLINEWNYLKGIHQKINEKMERLYEQLHEQYNAYIDSSEFLEKQNVTPSADIENLMKTTIQKRLGVIQK